MQAQERFLKYITFDTQSDEASETCPSTEKQKRLGEALRDELTALGARNAELDENGYVYATIPASAGCEKAPVLALIAHMDTSPDAPGKDVRAHIVTNYDGRDIVLNEGKGIVTHVEEFPELLKYVGKDLIVTDGTTLLGADDKAGVAEIMTAAERLLAKDAPKHPEIRVVFTPDEEIGRGVSCINMDKVNAAYGFTVDGAEIGELSYESFNAASAHVHIRGVGVHPGAAFGIMRNASLLAMEFHAMLPALEIPAATVGRMGFFHLVGMEGKMEEADLQYILRDHDAGKLEKRKELLLSAAAYMCEKYGAGAVEVTLTDSYRNMYEMLMPAHAELIAAARRAITEEGITPIEEPIRGGTDGAALSFMGLPCPNLGTGGHAFHGVHEFIPVYAMEHSVNILLRLAALLS